MPGIEPVSALSLWENSGGLSPLDRGVRLAAAISGISVDAAADLPLSQRDRLLLAELQRLSGGQVEVVAHCPSCATLHEAAIAPATLLAAKDAVKPRVRIGRHMAAIRPPTSRELADAVASGTIDQLALCCTSPAKLPTAGDARSAIETAIEQAFPLLNIMIAMECDACGTGFAHRFDPVALLWEEVVALARRALAEVDLLARVYGWSEADIFALSPARRRHYCAMAAA